MRAGTMDEYVPGQLNQYKTLEVDGKRVLDLGAHIGGFTKMVLDRGAAFCYAVEPVLANIELWKMNLAGRFNTILAECMVLGKYELDNKHYKDMKLYLSNGDTTGHTAYETRGRSYINVRAVSLDFLLEDAKDITVAKIDIEGAEYGIMHDAAELFPAYGIVQFAAELHLNRKGQRESAHKFVELFSKNYTQQVPVKLSGKLWNTTGVWRIK
jgi:FkbM family methyltransferase